MHHTSVCRDHIGDTMMENEGENVRSHSHLKCGGDLSSTEDNFFDNSITSGLQFNHSDGKQYQICAAQVMQGNLFQ